MKPDDQRILRARIRRNLISFRSGEEEDSSSAQSLPPGGDFGLRPGGHAPDLGSIACSPAAVLVPLVVRETGLTVLLTQRTDHLTSHAGQISFPGGREEESDGSSEETALRETEEEIGLGRERIEVVGRLDRYQTVTGFLVTPIVGFVEAGFDLKLDPHEVADAFELPLGVALARENFRTRTLEWEGREREFYYIEYGDRFIWGATAGMLLNLCLRCARD